MKASDTVKEAGDRQKSHQRRVDRTPNVVLDPTNQRAAFLSLALLSPSPATAKGWPQVLSLWGS